MRTAVLAMALAAAASAVAQPRGDLAKLFPEDVLDGWTTVSGTWTIEQGELKGHAEDGAPAVLLSDAEYGAFELAVLMKLSAPGRAGTLFYAHHLPAFPEMGPFHHVHGEGLLIDTRAERGQWVPVHLTSAGAAIDARGESTPLPRDAWHTFFLNANHGGISAGRVLPEGVRSNMYNAELVRAGKLAFVVLPAEDGTPLEVSFGVPHIGVVEAKPPVDFLATADASAFTAVGDADWRLADGVLTLTKGSVLWPATTPAFHFRGQFKMDDTAAGGVLFNAASEDAGEGPVVKGMAIALAGAVPGPSGLLKQLPEATLHTELDPEAVSAFAVRPGEWNEIQITATGNVVRVFVNGLRVTELWGAVLPYTEGLAGLRHDGQGGPITWRMISMTP